MHFITFLPKKGIYTLLLLVKKEVQLQIGKLGIQKFPKGSYTYTGSALGSGSSDMKNRISRHFLKKKKKFWHMDYLLDNDNVNITGLITSQTERQLECKINLNLKSKNGKIQVPKFGSSDCQGNCGSHLLFYSGLEEEYELSRKIIECYKNFMLNPQYIKISNKRSTCV